MNSIVNSKKCGLKCQYIIRLEVTYLFSLQFKNYEISLETGYTDRSKRTILVAHKIKISIMYQSILLRIMETGKHFMKPYLILKKHNCCTNDTR